MKPPKIGTKASSEFFGSWEEINKLLQFIIHLASTVEHAQTTAHDVLVKTAKDEEERNRLLSGWGKRRSPIQDLKENRQILLEIILVRHIENFLNYLSTVLFEIFTSKPETLRTSDKVEVSKVLQHTSIESLVLELAEEKVERLSYSSFYDLNDFFNERFNLEVAPLEKVEEISRFIETRNISVHNRCVINKRYIFKTGTPESDLGKKKLLVLDDIKKLSPLLAVVVKDLDSKTRKKFKIKGVRFAE